MSASFRGLSSGRERPVLASMLCMQRALTCRKRERRELHECLAPEANSQYHWLWSAVVPETTTCTADESKADAAPLWHQQ